MLELNGSRALRPPAGGRDRGPGAAQPLPAAGHRRAARREDAPAAGRGAGRAGPFADAGAAHRRGADRLAARGSAHAETSTGGSSSSRASTPTRSRSTAARSRSNRSRPRRWRRRSRSRSSGSGSSRSSWAMRSACARRARSSGSAPTSPGGFRSCSSTARPRARRAGPTWSTTCSPTRVCAIATRTGSSPTTRAIRSRTPAISSAKRSRRRSLAPTRTGNDPCVRDMVVMGHSQGGLLTKLTVIDSGDAFWKSISEQAVRRREARARRQGAPARARCS